MFSIKKQYAMHANDIQWQANKVAVVGAGCSGRAAAKLLYHLGAQVRIIDKSIDCIPKDFIEWARDVGCEILHGDHNAEQFSDIDILIPSPGIALSYLKQFITTEKNICILSEIELAWYQLCHEKVVAITGTSGKTTITSLCAAMLTEQGFHVFVGGNIGTPFSEYVLCEEKADIVVLEVSSFQLQTCSLFRPDIAIFVNISPNHLDYHTDMDEYLSAKMHICKNQNANDRAIFHPEMKELVAKYNIQSQIAFYQDTGVFSNNQLLGKHNRENIEAAWLACKELGVTFESAKQAVANFEPLEHRLEQVRRLHGTLYVNDSKGTTVEALRVALEAFEQPILLLAGGKFKGGDLAGLRSIIKEKVRAVGLFGGSREYFENAWSDIVPMTWDETLEAAVKRLTEVSCEGDVVLLAPATSSFDQYTDYIERGKDFKRVVQEVLL